MKVPAAFALAALVALAPARAWSAPAPWLEPPVDGAIVRAFEAPAGPFAPGHRGIDYSVPAGTLVRAAGAGTVTFAGPVAGTTAVTIDHGDGLETTYTDLASVLVRSGEGVARGTWLGRTDRAHPGGQPGVHFGVKLDGAYVDPALYLGPVDVAGAIHLAPTTWQPPDVLTDAFRSAFDDPGDYRSACRDARSIPERPPPPNDNVAVTIAGIASQTRGSVSSPFGATPARLGYSPASTYRFSYAGAAGPSLHLPYGRVDTYGDLRLAAERLRTLLARIARTRPGRHVDLIAHSQGGIVARLFLQSQSAAWDARLPVVDHLVTFATPHGGAPLAGDVAGLDHDTVTGRAFLDALSRTARAGAAWPDPRSPAVSELAPGSSLMDGLAHEDVAFGTRALSLGAAGDVIAPADRTRLPGSLSRVVGPPGLSGHSAITGSPAALALAYGFLRDAAAPCRGPWDLWGPRIGAATGWAEARLPWVYGTFERGITGAPLWGALHKS